LRIDSTIQTIASRSVQFSQSTQTRDLSIACVFPIR
jgi:hypothetical protein